MTARAHGLRGGGLAADARGVVIVEFLIAFVPLFLLLLATTQLGLIAAAQLVVHHAAVAGVRAAIVVLDDEPRWYAGTERGSIAGSGESDPGWSRRFGSLLGGGDGAAYSTPPQTREGPRMLAIRRAVTARIAAIAPDPNLLHWLSDPSAPLSVGAALGAQPLARLAFALSRYVGITTALTFPTAPGARTVSETRVDQSARITLRVTHLFVCLVPIVSSLICDALVWDARTHSLAEPTPRTRTQAQRARELQLAAFAGDQRDLANAGMRAWLLSAEATLPAQAAAYRYASERRGAVSP